MAIHHLAGNASIDVAGIQQQWQDVLQVSKSMALAAKRRMLDLQPILTGRQGIHA